MVSSKLIEHIEKIVELDDSEKLILMKYVKIIQLKNREYLLKEGQICRNLHFVEKGCLRMFFINKKGSEQIVQFALENWWMSDFLSFMNHNPSEYFIQSIERSQIITIDNQLFEELLSEIPKLERYFRIVMQKTVSASQHRSKLMYEMSKEEFFVHFSTTFPEFMQRVPQYMIAAYLGITPEYLSELRKKN
jgi:CRP/FNR family transcriptional regulator, anaerobic regulatory protein